MREIARPARPLRHRAGLGRRARPARARRDRHHLHRQCRSEGARRRRPVRPARAGRRQRPVRRGARRPAGHLLGALGARRSAACRPRPSPGESERRARLQPRHAPGPGRAGGARPRGQPQRPFRLRARALLARRPQRMVRRPRRRHPGLAAARRQRLRLRPDLRPRRPRRRPSARWTRPRSTRSATARTPSASWWRRCCDSRPLISRREAGDVESALRVGLPDSTAAIPASAGTTERCRSWPSTSTGRSASPNAPIATSTAMSASRSTRRSGARRCSPIWRMRRAQTPGRRLGSIFFGGGTPSLMPPATVAALIEAAEAHWGFAPDIEITLEANPSSVEAARFADLAARRRQPGLARPAVARRRGAALPRPRPRRRRRAGGARHRAGAFRPGQLRPDLRPARPERRRPGRPSSPAPSPSAPAISRSTS